MQSLALYISRRPRRMSAIAFGAGTAALIHFSWVADARMSGATPYWTAAVGVLHAAAAAVTGPRIVRTRAWSYACVLGAETSLLALAVLIPVFALWVALPNNALTGAWALVAEVTLICGFAFVSAGWALVLVSAAIGWALYRVTQTAGTRTGPSYPEPRTLNP